MGAKVRLEAATTTTTPLRILLPFLRSIGFFFWNRNPPTPPPQGHQVVIGEEGGMVRSSSSSTSSCASIGSLEDVSVKSGGSSGASAVKFLCSYGGKILPRYPDGKLRYVGGDTRVLAVDRSVSYSELQAKMRELCGWGAPVNVRCQLPTEDLDALVSVTSDEDLKNLFEEYDLASAAKIRAFLLPSPLPSSSTSPTTSSSKPSSKSPTASPVLGGVGAPATAGRCVHQMAPPVAETRLIASRYEKPAVAAGEVRFHGHHSHHHGHGHNHHGHHASPRSFLVHHGNHWQ